MTMNSLLGTMVKGYLHLVNLLAEPGSLISWVD